MRGVYIYIYICRCIYMGRQSYTHIYTYTLQTKHLEKVLPSSFTQRASDPDPLLLKAGQTKQPHGAAKKGRWFWWLSKDWKLILRSWQLPGSMWKNINGGKYNQAQNWKCHLTWWSSYSLSVGSCSFLTICNTVTSMTVFVQPGKHRCWMFEFSFSYLSWDYIHTNI